MKTLSIIVPVYNVEKYIRRCLESIFNQSYKNFEVIIVDDKSTDTSVKSIEDLACQYKSTDIQIVGSSENGGAGHARNIGFQKSQGKYIGFVDGDDWIDSNFYYNLVCALESSDCDIAVCGMQTEYDNTSSSTLRYRYSLLNHVSGDYALGLLSRANANDIYITPIVNNKLYRRSYLEMNGLSFLANSYNEDDVFTFCCFLNAERVALVPETVYHYYQRPNSITHSFSKKHIDDLITAFRIIKEILNEKNMFAKHKDAFYSFFDKCISSNLSRLFKFEQSSRVQKEYLSYFFESFMNSFSLYEAINYLDLHRLKGFLNIEP